MPRLSDEEIKKLEDAGLDVLEVSTRGKIQYESKKVENTVCCRACENFRLLPDSDSNDWFRDNDQKAVCTANKEVLARFLDPWEASEIGREGILSKNCPKIKK